MFICISINNRVYFINAFLRVGGEGVCEPASVSVPSPRRMDWPRELVGRFFLLHMSAPSKLAPIGAHVSLMSSFVNPFGAIIL